MFKYFISISLFLIGVLFLFEAQGRDGRGYGGAGGYARRPDPYAYQRAPTLSRAYRYSNPEGGWSSGGTTVVTPGYYPPPSGQPQPSPYQGPSGQPQPPPYQGP